MIKPCPFCGEQPEFYGDVSDWQDDCRYVELSLTCCVSMTAAIGWRKAREMTVRDRVEHLKSELISNWNKRTEPENL